MNLIRTSRIACAFGELGERISKNELTKSKVSQVLSNFEKPNQSKLL